MYLMFYLLDGDDVTVQLGTFVFLSTDDEHFLPVTIIEDEIAEEEEEVTIIITVPGTQPPHIISLIIQDNDGKCMPRLEHGIILL